MKQVEIIFFAYILIRVCREIDQVNSFVHVKRKKEGEMKRKMQQKLTDLLPMHPSVPPGNIRKP